MRAFIVSDHQPMAARVRQVLLGRGQECAAGDVVPLEVAVDRLAQSHADLLVLLLSPHPQQALALLTALRLLTQARLLVIGPSADTRLVLQALRAGANDYVNEEDLEGELDAALGRLRAEVGAAAELGRVIALLAPNGGSGSSTLAVNVAATLARDHKSALLLDLKLQTGDLAALLDLKPTHTVADLCDNASRMDRIMFERSLARHASGVHLLAAPRHIADVSHVTPEGVRQALLLGRALFPYVVADLDHSFREEQTQVLRAAEQIVLVFRLDFVSLRNAQRALDYLAQLGIDRARVQAVVNRYGQANEVPAAKAEDALGVKISHYVPDDARTINRAANDGVPAVLESPSARVSRSLVKLAASLNGRHRG
jgi:pilus assembly protein CpaE